MSPTRQPAASPLAGVAVSAIVGSELPTEVPNGYHCVMATPSASAAPSTSTSTSTSNDVASGVETPTARWLFVRTCQDLVKKQRSADYYDKLRMAGLLRHLLVGPRSLVAGANRETGLELEFWYREPDADVAAHPWEGPKGFDASRRELASGQVVKSDLNTFLGARIVHFGQWLSVQQLIEVVAHAYGGQYSLLPEDVPEDAMHALSEAAKEGPAGRLAVALHEITGAVLRALIPLANPSGEPRKPRPIKTPAPSAGGCPFSGS